MLDIRLHTLYEKIDELESQERWLDLVGVYQECIRISLEVYGENHDETLALYSEYGGLLRNLGRYEEALQVLHKALNCARILKGPAHLDYGAALVNLANLLRMMKYFKESETFFLQAKNIYEKNHGTKLFQYAGLCNNLGLLYQDMEQYERAIPLHKKSLEILKNDSNHEVLYGVTLNNLVEPYKHTGRRSLAIQYLKDAISIFEKYMNTASVLYAASMNNLGIIYYEDGLYHEAEKCFKAALDISRKKLGTDSESYKHSLRNYERTLRKLQITEITGAAAADSAAAEVLTDREHPVKSISENSSGLELAEAYFFDICYPMLKEEFEKYLPRMAAGLVGEGSECYGFDDKISRDHDFGPSFQIYIPAEDMGVYGKELSGRIAALPKSYCGFAGRNSCTLDDNRVGVLTIEDFYDKFLSIHEVPSTNRLWLQMNDLSLSTATNGKVFMDNLGQFTKIREGLLKHYPADVCLKRLAYACTQIAQSGQYNFPRSLQRRQFVAATHALDEFVHHYASFIYLINKTYKPYYKWEHEGLKRLPQMGQLTWRELNKLVLIPFQEKPKYAIFVIEDLCKKAIAWLQKKNLTASKSDFLLDHAPHILSHASDEMIRNSNPWLEK